jgi:hypothetical protein
MIANAEKHYFLQPSKMDVCDCNIGACVVRYCRLRVFGKNKKTAA